MLAVVAAVLAILAGLDVTLGALSPFDLACFALAALSLHFVGPLVTGWRTRP